MPRPSQTYLEKLHRPESCRSNRRTGSYTDLSSSTLPHSRPRTASQHNLASTDIATPRPRTAVWKSSSHSDLSNKTDRSHQLSTQPLSRSFSNNDLLRPRSSLRRERSNTHLINGFYQVFYTEFVFMIERKLFQKPSDDLNEQFYNHGPYYQNPEQSPYSSDFPRVFKSDAASFFNGKVYTIREPPK